MLAVLYFFLHGIPCIYQGQEIGMENTTFNSPDDFDDIGTIDAYKVAIDAGLSEEEKKAVPEIRAPYDTDVYCVTCNKTVHVKAGEVVPFCCGRLMEILD